MKLDKILKRLPEAVVEELKVMDLETLRATIADSEEAVVQAQRQRDENPQYQAAKQAVSDLSQGLRDLRSYQRAKIHFALLRIQELKEGTNNE